MPDLYDEQIAALRRIHARDGPGAFHKAVEMEWSYGVGLFAFAFPPGGDALTGRCGCLTMIRRQTLDQPREAVGVDRKPDPVLTARIRDDYRIPTEPRLITTGALDVLAEWQRELDALYGCQPSLRAFNRPSTLSPSEA